jgi:hypothetical protein
MQGLVVVPKPVAQKAGTATADLHVLSAGKDGQGELAEVEPTVMAVGVVRSVCRGLVHKFLQDSLRFWFGVGAAHQGSR